MLEGSHGSDELPVLESVPESTFAAVGEGDTVWVKMGKARAVAHTLAGTTRCCGSYLRDSSERKASGISAGSPLPLPQASPEPDQLPLPSMLLPLKPLPLLLLSVTYPLPEPDPKAKVVCNELLSRNSTSKHVIHILQLLPTVCSYTRCAMGLSVAMCTNF